jgi:hypothetical protein
MQEAGKPLTRFSRNLKRMMQRGGGGDEAGQAAYAPHPPHDAPGDEAPPGGGGAAPRRRVLGALTSRLKFGRDRNGGAAAGDPLPTTSSFDYETGMGYPQVCFSGLAPSNAQQRQVRASSRRMLCRSHGTLC